MSKVASKKAAVMDDGTTGDALFLSVAISDLINAVAHGYAASVMTTVSVPAALGFGIVAIAAFIGTLRFGVSARTFRPANEGLAEMAGVVGLPLVGFAAALHVLPYNHWVLRVEPVVISVALSLLFTVLQTLPAAVRNEGRKLVATIFFIGPVLLAGLFLRDWKLVSLLMTGSRMGLV
jgi:hypothetical protein